MNKYLITLIPFLLYLFIPIETDAQQKYRSVEQALFSSGQLTGEDGPENVTWIDGGDRYSYMQYNRSEESNEIRIYNPANGEDILVFRDSEYTFPGTDEPFSYRSFQWSNNFEYIIFQSNFQSIYRNSGTADYYFYSVDDQSLKQIVANTFTAEISPDGEKVAYHRDGEMYVFDLGSEEETQLTFDSQKNVFNGRFGWVYEEEFSLVQAWKWSPDSKYIAFWQTDERDVKRFVSTDYEGQYPEYTDIPYPKVGAENPSVKIGVIEVESGDNRWLTETDDDELIPRVLWTRNPGQLAIVQMNRQQNHVELSFYNVESGESRLVMEESSDNGWIEVYDHRSDLESYFVFPEDKEEFLWLSTRDGYKHVYRYNYDGELLNQVTSGDWEVMNILAVNPENERIYFLSSEVSPLERHLYSIRFDGTGKEKYTEASGMHAISMGQNGRYFIDTWSNVNTPTQVELWTTEDGGEQLEIFVDNRAVKEYVRDFAYSPRELIKVETSDGRELDAYIIKPTDFDPDQSYPLVLMIYGGPSSQGVENEFETSTWYQYLAQQGYVIANVNNRGSSGYGWNFENAVYKNLGELEAEDFAETATYLSSTYDWIDGERMAIRGHSYGGYMAALTMVLHPGVFKASIVAAPVTDWRLYDTIYTERYMGLLEENEENYINSSVMAHADKLKGEMLVVHSSMDENVHIQNTMQMLTAFTSAGKDVEVRIYPPGAHGVAYNLQSRILLYKTYTEFLKRMLKPVQQESIQTSSR